MKLSKFSLLKIIKKLNEFLLALNYCDSDWRTKY